MSTSVRTSTPSSSVAGSHAGFSATPARSSWRAFSASAALSLPSRRAASTAGSSSSNVRTSERMSCRTIPRRRGEDSIPTVPSSLKKSCASWDGARRPPSGMDGYAAGKSSSRCSSLRTMRVKS